MSEKKELALNFIANFVYLIINYAITFFLTSYIVNEISSEAYGFISLCNKVVDYATLITIALNSVAGRFITLEMHRNNKKKANQYFSSTLAADGVICLGIMAVFIPMAINIDKIFEIPPELVTDVKRLFFIITLNLLVTVISTVYTVATFITNKLYLASIANMVGNLVRASMLYILLKFYSSSIVYVGIATISSSLIIFLMNFAYTRYLCPELKIKRIDIIAMRVKELFISGIWNSVTKLSQILSDGLDLVISNIWVSAYAMGQLSIAYTIPTIVSAFLGMIINIFNPKLTEYYAKNDIEKIVSELTMNMKMTGFFGNVIFFGLVLMGKNFFKLWVPESEIDMIYILMLFATASLLVSSITSPLSNVFLLTNKLKVNSILWLCVSAFDSVLVIILVAFTNIGVYAVAGVSKIVGSIVNLIFLPVYASYYLRIKSKYFYKLIKKYFVTTVVVGLFMGGSSFLIGECNGWFSFITKAFILAISGFTVNFVLLLDKNERAYLLFTIKNKLRRS